MIIPRSSEWIAVGAIEVSCAPPNTEFSSALSRSPHMTAPAATRTPDDVLIAPAEAPEEHVTEAPAGAPPEWMLHDRLPPPMHAQVEYWRQLCGVLSVTKGRGVANDGWPPDLAPTRSTLRAVVERGLIVCRQRAWHCKRNWYRRLTSLRE